MIYLDNAATTPVSKEVIDEMIPYLTTEFGNPSSIHSMGRTAKRAIELARERVATAINAQSEQIIFTSGATEGNNLVRQLFVNTKRTYTTTAIEHPSNLNFTGYIGDCHSTMLVNNETGNIVLNDSTIQLVKDMGSKLHCDCTQGFGHLPIDVEKMRLDFATFSGHKIFAPKGIGVLYVREPQKFKTSFIGGGQEQGIRNGTENVAGIVGIGKAFELYNYNAEAEKNNLLKRHRLIEELCTIEDMRINTILDRSISTTLNISFKGLEGETLVLLLDLDGICVSAGSACHSGTSTPSYVLQNMSIPEEYVDGTIRISFTQFTSAEDLSFAVGKIKERVKQLRGY